MFVSEVEYAHGPFLGIAPEERGGVLQTLRHDRSQLVTRSHHLEAVQKLQPLHICLGLVLL